MVASSSHMVLDATLLLKCLANYRMNSATFGLEILIPLKAIFTKMIKLSIAEIPS